MMAVLVTADASCPKCGTPHDADDRFCMLCGYDFHESIANRQSPRLRDWGPRLLLAVVGGVLVFNVVLQFALYLVPGRGTVAEIPALATGILVGIVVAVRGLDRLMAAVLWGAAASFAVFGGLGMVRYFATGEASRDGVLELIALVAGVGVGIVVAIRGR